MNQARKLFRPLSSWRRHSTRALTVSLALSGSVWAQADGRTKELGVVVVDSGRPSSLPTYIPTTMETVTAAQIESSINATDSEDAIKYLPSLSIRKRYTGDYNHAVLMSRASGTGNSARTAVYADGILLSNYLGNGATYAPRWGMVTPEEIERVDVMYGPFSAAYGGNSVGGVVDYVTRLPKSFEAHMKVSAFTYEHDMYATQSNYGGTQSSASIGNKVGDWSYWVNFNRTQSTSHPLGYVNVAPGNNTCPNANCAASAQVQGIVTTKAKDNSNLAILGTTTAYDTVQDHAKLKLAYDISSTLRATYSFGYWENNAQSKSASYMTKNGSPYFGTTGGYVNDGANYFKIPSGLSGFYESQDKLIHYMQNFSLKTNTQEKFDWEVKASLFDYKKDEGRLTGSNSATQLYTGSGSMTDASGSGWNSLAFKGIWRPDGKAGAHVYDFGIQRDRYTLKTATFNTGVDWMNAAAASLSSWSGGATQTDAMYVQDVWKFAPLWKAVLGLRAEDWTASGGYVGTSASPTTYSDRHEFHLSPKAALSHQLRDDLVIKGSLARSLRMPTPQELYSNVSTSGAGTFLNDPNLKPEVNTTSEISVEKDLGLGLLRVTGFFENTRDAIYSQKGALDATINNVQNIKRIESKGLEIAYYGSDLIRKGLDLSGSVTYVDSIIKENNGFVSVAGDTIGKDQPRVPQWRATALANYHWNSRLNTSLGMRYSGPQFTTLNNADVNGFAYTAASRFFVVDTRIRYVVDKQWSVAAGIDNLNNYKYWNFHLYPGRTYFAELKYDMR
jgi:iron complex outermembrane receptor protein